MIDLQEPRLKESWNHGSNWLRIWFIDKTHHQIFDSDGEIHLQLNRVYTIFIHKKPQFVVKTMNEFFNFPSVLDALDFYDQWASCPYSVLGETGAMVTNA